MMRDRADSLVHYIGACSTVVVHLSYIIVCGRLEGHWGIDRLGFFGEGSGTCFEGFANVASSGDKYSAGCGSSADQAGIYIGGILGVSEVICLNRSNL